MTAKTPPLRLSTAAHPTVRHGSAVLEWAAAAGLTVLLSLGAPARIAAENTKQFFPIMGWNLTPSDPAAFKKMRECGLTIAGFVPPHQLDMCQAAGLKAIVADPRASDYDWRNVREAVVRRNVAKLTSETRQHPAVYGYLLKDEPSLELFPGLAKVAGAIGELAPGKWAYINLFPNYANSQQLGTSSYREYLERFIAMLKPTVLSYDYYSLLEDGSLRSGYWDNLEQVRSITKEHAISFWSVVLAVAHFRYREPTPSDLRFEVYTSLAYGARGIAYFTYFAPKEGNYRAAAIDQFGNPTITWQHLQNVNLQVEKLAPTLLALRSDTAYHIGRVPEGSHGPSGDSLIIGIEGGDFLVGDFTHADGTRYVMVVNKDLVHSRSCAPRFRVSPRRTEIISAYTGQSAAFSYEQRWLAPGQGMLLKVVR